MKKQQLTLQETLYFDVGSRFMFEKTFYRPSEFPAKLDLFDKGQPSYYQALNLGSVLLGLKYTMSDGRLCLDVYSEKKLEPDTPGKVDKEIRLRLSLDGCDSLFYDEYVDDRFVGEIIRKSRGRLRFVKYSLYENLMVAVFLQNATVQRTISMCHNMLSRYGTLLCFDEIEIFAMWRPEELRATDEELRELKVGYRAKNILRITEHFVTGNVSESALRELPTDKLEKELLKIYGVGKQTVFYVIGRAEYLKHISLWERKILSRYIFDEELCEEKHLVDWFHEHYHQWCGLAFSLIFEDIFFQHRAKPFPWLKKIMRQD